MKRLTLILTGAALSLSLAGCVSGGSKNCDALNAGNFFEDQGCKGSGGYDARLQEIQAATQRKVAEAATARSESSVAREEAAKLSRDATGLRKRSDALAADLARLSLTLKSVKAGNAEKKARLDALNAELDRAKAELARARDGSAASPEEVARIQQRVDGKRAAIEELVKTTVE